MKRKISLTITLQTRQLHRLKKLMDRHGVRLVTVLLTALSILCFISYHRNGLGLAYNDARSHLDIGRRVVEGLKPGIAQLGSVWLPLNHILMVPLVWNDWMWHSGFAGAIWNMLAFIITGVYIYKFLESVQVKLIGRLFGVAIFAANINTLYLQSTAMTEPLLMATFMAGSYHLLRWSKNDDVLHLIKAAFWIMLATMVRYDGWFMLAFAALTIAIVVFRRHGYTETEGKIILFITLGAFGVALWFIWNLVIFKDPLYFMLGPFSAHAQQEQMDLAGDLPTKNNLLLSTKVFFYSLMYNLYSIPLLFGVWGAVLFWLDKKIRIGLKIISTVLISPLIFNILALFFGFSVIFVQGISGDTWFNIRYGILLAPTVAVFCGYLVERLKDMRWVVIGLSSFVLFFAFANRDAVTIDDARVGSSQKNVTEVSGWLKQNTADKDGFILISAASHDAIIFSSGLPMKKFIHEGTGAYWESATTAPNQWARWIVMRTYDNNDLTYKFVSHSEGFTRYDLVDSYPFADIYQLKDAYVGQLHTKPVFTNQK